MKIRHDNVSTLESYEIEEVLKSNSMGHLGCQHKGEVYIVPITYIYQDKCFFFHTLPGKKTQMMEENSKICLQVESVQHPFRWKSVIAWGEYEPLEGDEADRVMRQLVAQMVQAQKIEKISNVDMDMSSILERSVVFQMKVQKVTGRFQDQAPLK